MAPFETSQLYSFLQLEERAVNAKKGENPATGENPTSIKPEDTTMMINERQDMMDQISEYIDQHPDGITRLRAFLESSVDDDALLWDTTDMMAYTGWGRTHILRLCAEGKLPYVPGKPHKFVPARVREALEKMQIGGGYGKRQSKMKARKIAR